MSQKPTLEFQPRGCTTNIEQGSAFQPKFDGDGLIPAIVTSGKTGGVLMFAWMNKDALWRTIETRQGHFWSRSRQKLWRKGEESGNALTVTDVRVDCDQDVVWLICDLAGDGNACHTGAKSCFYRAIELTAKDPKSIALKPIG